MPVYDLLKTCWEKNPEDRPTFDAIGRVLEVQLRKRGRRQTKFTMVAAAARLQVRARSGIAAGFRKASVSADIGVKVHARPDRKTSGQLRDTSKQEQNEYTSFGDTSFGDDNDQANNFDGGSNEGEKVSIKEDEEVATEFENVNGFDGYDSNEERSDSGAGTQSARLSSRKASVSLDDVMSAEPRDERPDVVAKVSEEMWSDEHRRGSMVF